MKEWQLFFKKMIYSSMKESHPKESHVTWLRLSTAVLCLAFPATSRQAEGALSSLCAREAQLGSGGNVTLKTGLQPARVLSIRVRFLADSPEVTFFQGN